MSEHIPAELRIGGKLPLALVPELCQLIASEYAALDWDGGNFAPTGKEDLLAACEDHAGVRLLCLYDVEARWGEFERLEAFLQQHGIAYDRFSDPKYEYSAEWVQCRPGRPPLVLTTDPAHCPVVQTDMVQPVAVTLRRAVSLLARGQHQGADRAMRRALRILRRVLLPPMAPLESFEIEGSDCPGGADG